jgi:type IV secretory pathway TraG/TraD family ATPase VirD4
VYVALDSLTDPGVSELIASSMMADLTSLAGKFYNEKQRDPSFKTPKVMVYADELKEVISTEIIQFVNKARGAGFYFTGFMQSMSDPVSALGNQNSADVFLDNFNNTFMFSVKNEKSAKYLTDMVPTVSINTQTIIAGSTDRSSTDSDEDFTSNSEIRKQEKDVPLISKADILELPKGQCFASIDGGQIYKLKMPLVKVDRSITPETLKEKVRKMRRAYRRSVA